MGAPANPQPMVKLNKIVGELTHRRAAPDKLQMRFLIKYPSFFSFKQCYLLATFSMVSQLSPVALHPGCQ